MEKPKKKWKLDKDNDGWGQSQETGADEGSPGDGWIPGTVQGPDCDDSPTGANVHKLNKCKKCEPEPVDGNCHCKAINVPKPPNCNFCTFNSQSCKWEVCPVRTGLSHVANFGSNPTLGDNTQIKTDNFRHEDGTFFGDANCGTGKIDSGSTVKILDLNTIKVKRQTGTDSNGNPVFASTESEYYKVEYEDCPKGNNSNTGLDTNKPCSDCFKGNPVKGSMNLAKQKASGFNGATKGLTRKKSKTITDPVTKKKKKILVPKEHKGVDIETKEGDPIYAMFDGTARLKTNTKNGKVVGGGYYVALVSTVNGQRVETWYFHMEKDTRVSGSVKAGDIIGYQGLSGNLEDAVDNKSTPVHVHIQLYENGKLKDPLPYLKAGLDKTTGKFTNESDCND